MNLLHALSVGIIGGADGPTQIYLAALPSLPLTLAVTAAAAAVMVIAGIAAHR